MSENSTGLAQYGLCVSAELLTNISDLFDVPTQRLSVFKSFVKSNVFKDFWKTCAFDQLRFWLDEECLDLWIKFKLKLLGLFKST